MKKKLIQTIKGSLILTVILGLMALFAYNLFENTVETGIVAIIVFIIAGGFYVGDTL